MEMRLTYDKEVDAAYIYLKEISEGEVAQTISINDSINVDLDSEGKVLGIEILNASENLSLSTLESINNI